MSSLKQFVSTLLLFCSLLSYGQQYPVEVHVAATPPYEQSLRAYWSSPERKIQVHLLLKDLHSATQQIALRFSLENMQGGIIAQTSDYALPYLETLTPSQRITLDNQQFRQLFAFENLTGITQPFYDNLLPEGGYFLCFRAFNPVTQMPVSNKGRAYIQIRRFSPPLLTLPHRGEVLSKLSDFQQLLFQWTPRDPVPFTRYEFTLKEVWDLSLSAEEAFLSGRLIHQEETSATSLLYGVDKPLLTDNKRYVWRVRAFTDNPNAAMDTPSYFKNGGTSEVFYFDYISQCQPPQMLSAKAQSHSANVQWIGSLPIGSEGSYKVMYREKGKTWHSQLASQPSTTLVGLKDGKRYIYKVGVPCNLQGGNVGVFGGQAYAFSPEQEFNTPQKTDKEGNVQCGTKPTIRITNREPLQDPLAPNDTFIAGDFPVTVLEAQGGGGTYSGKGIVEIPYLANSKVLVTFSNIKLNTNRQLIDGVLVTTYDKTEKNVNFLQEGVGELFGDRGIKGHKVPFEIDHIKVDNSTQPPRITIIGKTDPATGNAPTMELPTGRDYQIVDSAGKVYSVDEGGNTTDIGKLSSTKLAHKPTYKASTGKGGTPTQVVSDNFTVRWDFEGSNYAYDTRGEVPYKALVKDKDDHFNVLISQKDTTAYRFVFRNEKGVEIPSKELEKGKFELSCKGLYDFADEPLWVVAVPKKGGKDAQGEVISQCVLVHLAEKEINVVLVPTSKGVRITDAALKEVSAIYQRVGVQLHFSEEAVFDISKFLQDGKLPTENKLGDLSTYSPEQNAIISEFKQSHSVKSDAYYLFITDSGSSTGQGGYMRLNGQFGFVYGLNPKVLAHELGHGAFQLEHPKASDLLMSASGEGTAFAYEQWKQINDPKVKLYAFQGQGEGEKYHILSLLEKIKKGSGNGDFSINFIKDYEWKIDKEGSYPISSIDKIDLDGDHIEEKVETIVKGGVANKDYIIDLRITNGLYNSCSIDYEIGVEKKNFFCLVFKNKKNQQVFQFKVEDFSTYQKLLTYLSMKLTDKALASLIQKYKEEIFSTNNCNELDYLFEAIGDSITTKLPKETVWRALVSLSQCSMGESWGTKEETAAINILRGIEDKEYLYNQLYNHQEVVYDLYQRIDGDNLITYLTILAELVDHYAEKTPDNNYCYLGVVPPDRFITDIDDIDAHHKKKHIKSRVIDSSKGVELQITPLSDFYKSNLLDLVCAYKNYRNYDQGYDELPLIYIYHLSKKQEQKEFLEVVNYFSTFAGLYGSARILFAKTVGVIAKSIAITEISNLAITTYVNNHQEELSRLGKEGKWIAENWNKISIGIDLATFSTAFLNDFVRNGSVVSSKLNTRGAEKEAKELDEITESFRKELAKREKIYGNKVEKNALGNGESLSELAKKVSKEYDLLIKNGLKIEKKANTIIFRNKQGETVASVFNNKLRPNKWIANYNSEKLGYKKIGEKDGYWIYSKENGDIRFDIGFRKERKLESREVNDYLVNGQKKDLDGQPYWAGTEVEEIILGNNNEIIYFVENYKNGIPNPGQYASKEAITTIKELRQKLAVKEAWKPTSEIPTLRAYKVKTPLRVRSGIIGPQIDNGVKLQGGGHQYEIIDYLGNDWQKYLIPIDTKGVKLK
jgi:fibronectin type III domain protein